MTWKWVNFEQIFIFGWIVPLSVNTQTLLPSKTSVRTHKYTLLYYLPNSFVCKHQPLTGICLLLLLPLSLSLSFAPSSFSSSLALHLSFPVCFLPYPVLLSHAHTYFIIHKHVHFLSSCMLLQTGLGCWLLSVTKIKAQHTYRVDTSKSKSNTKSSSS